MRELVRIGCAAGFAGDRPDAALPIIAELANPGGFLVFETLVERTLALCRSVRAAMARKVFVHAPQRTLEHGHVSS